MTRFESVLWDAMERRDKPADRALSVLSSAVRDGDRRFLYLPGFELCCERMGFTSNLAVSAVRMLAIKCMGNES